MKKIPVGATIAHAYRFAFGNFFNILKLLWLPLAMLLAANIIVTPQLTAFTQALSTRDFSAVTMPWPLIVLGGAAIWIFSLMQATAIFQLALGQPQAQKRAYYLSFDRPLWRLIGALLLLILVLLTLAIVFVIAVLVILFLFRLGLGAAHISDNAIKGILAFDAIIAFLVGYCGLIFCGLRFGFLLGATTIAEGRIGLFRSWTLSHRNFWRMLAISLALFLPFFAVEMIIFYALDFFPHLPPGVTQAQMRALQNAAAAASIARMQHYWYLFYPGAAVLGLLLYGLMAGAGAFAYRVLTGTSTPSLP